MTQASPPGEQAATPTVVAGLIADGLDPLRDALKRIEGLLGELAIERRSQADEFLPASPKLGHQPNGKGNSLAWAGSLEHAPSHRPWLQRADLENGCFGADFVPVHPLEEEDHPRSSELHEDAASKLGAAASGDASPTELEQEVSTADNFPEQRSSNKNDMGSKPDLRRRNLDLRQIARGANAPPIKDTPSESVKKIVLSFYTRCCLRNYKEPVRKGRLNAIITSSKFENLCAMIIVVNSIFVAYTSDFEMKNTGQPHSTAVQGLEYAFIVFYTVELAMRLANHRLYFFINEDMKWNLFDFLLVALSGFDVVMTLLGPSSAGGGNVSFMRISRLLKLAKILRTLRVMKVFRDLSQILESFKNCMISLFWSLVMMVFVIYVFALIFIQGLSGYIDLGVSRGEVDDHAEIRELFGSMGTSMLSAYMAVTGGNDWALYYETVSKGGAIYSALFIFYMFFFAFALFNILTGVFVEKAVVSAQPEREEVILEQRRKNMQDASEFRHICQVLDTDNTGTISRAEFYESMQNDLMMSYMSAVGLHVRDVDLFFDLLIASTRQEENTDPLDMAVGIDEFVECCMAMRGMATNFDVQRQRFTLQGLIRSFNRFEENCIQQMNHIASEVQRLDGSAGGGNGPPVSNADYSPARL